MRWWKMTAVTGMMLAAGVAATAATLSGGGQTGQKERTPAPERRERVIVRPQIEEVFRPGGVWIGVQLRDVDQAAATQHKLPATEGALIESVREESPAEKAGLKAGDVIVSMDGERVRSVRQLQRLVGDTPAGRTVKMAVVREGKKLDLSITPEEPSAGERLLGRDLSGEIRRGVEEGLLALPRGDFNFRFDRPGGVYRFEGPRGTWRFEGPEGEEVTPLPSPRQAPPGFRVGPGPGLRWFFDATPGSGRLGVTIQELTPQLREYFGVKEGVLVATVNPDSAAATAGVKAGDVITSVNGKDVTTTEELSRAIREPADGAEITIGIIRDRKAQSLKVKLTGPGRGWQV